MAEYRTGDTEGASAKSFPGVKALDNVQLSARPGTVHALMGENGAGKSTLMKCLFGIYKMDAGEIYLDGEKIEVKNPDEAMKQRYRNGTSGAAAGSGKKRGREPVPGTLPGEKIWTDSE